MLVAAIALLTARASLAECASLGWHSAVRWDAHRSPGDAQGSQDGGVTQIVVSVAHMKRLGRVSGNSSGRVGIQQGRSFHVKAIIRGVVWRQTHAANYFGSTVPGRTTALDSARAVGFLCAAAEAHAVPFRHSAGIVVGLWVRDLLPIGVTWPLLVGPASLPAGLLSLARSSRGTCHDIHVTHG